MCLALNVAKMANGGILRTVLEEMQYLSKKPWAEIQEESKQGDESSEYKHVNAAIDRHLAMVGENHMDSCLPCHNGTPPNPQTRWRCNGMGACPPDCLTQPTPETSGPLPGTPAEMPSGNERAHTFQIDGLLSGYWYIHTPLVTAEI